MSKPQTMKNNNIPTLSRRRYKDVYVNPDKITRTPALRSSRFEATEHFEVEHRCLWRNDIPAHRLDFYLIFLVTAGEGIHSFGNQEHYIRKNMLCFIGPNIIHSWRSDDDDNSGYACTFSDEFYQGSGQAIRDQLSELPFFQIDGNAVLQLTDEQAEDYIQLFRLIEKEKQSQSQYSVEVLRGYLQVLIGKSRGYYHSNGSETVHLKQAGVRIVKAFTNLYMSDVNTIRSGKDIKLKSISDYAEQLGISQNHLNDVIRQITGQSAGQLMRTQLIRQATMCLKHSSKSISEIAYLLGFDDPSYFSRFYKKKTGKLPSDFRVNRQ